MGVLDKPPDADQAPPVHTLMWNYFNWTGDVSGYDWNNFKTDLPSQAAFSQSLLEYFSIIVMPQWNLVEKLMSDDITYKTEETAKALESGISKLHELLGKQAIMEFLDKHLRFPSMTVELIDFANANSDEEREKLAKYRKNLGILNTDEKESVLKGWQNLWGKIPGMSDQDIQSNMDKLTEQIKVAHLEVKGNGDMTYEHQLRKFYRGFAKERDARLQINAEGGKIVHKAG